MKALPDVNVLVPLGWRNHEQFSRADAWFEQTRRSSSFHLLTSPITELGFVRVSVQRARGAVTIKGATQLLQETLRQCGARHRFIADDEAIGAWPDWCEAASQTTDAYLLALATKHSAILATLDPAIPGAFILPGLD